MFVRSAATGACSHIITSSDTRAALRSPDQAVLLVLVYRGPVSLMLSKSKPLRCEYLTVQDSIYLVQTGGSQPNVTSASVIYVFAVCRRVRADFAGR